MMTFFYFPVFNVLYLYSLSLESESGVSPDFLFFILIYINPNLHSFRAIVNAKWYMLGKFSI